MKTLFKGIVILTTIIVVTVAIILGLGFIADLIGVDDCRVTEPSVSEYFLSGVIFILFYLSFVIVFLSIAYGLGKVFTYKE